ncbi:hypothetical protein AVT64_gp21 [Acinetobacter phage YMC11/12/R2315]|uniref:Uncharacterized protein n=5 Tax=Obolenskvirus TaxID=1915205 RepID=A0A0D4DC65_9CAUD|nr:hypothetical protein LD30_gp67 [Acinetobacter phage YMC-13-01-C62]YP_009203540.1 hypothetical protein AVT64_gp21 [Acinetobacter phage YMC11/12/R2315]YP_009291881.1 hypothetical protein BI012_gp09 [Acinetobacter phage LZ35]YP_009592162.1 hypothetical protein FDG67_gp11 [Acinetobacter phage vB_AbaM-IME-AB2]AJT61480.1 hypothetical protein ABA1215_00840 [Acinetobacter phage YMC11/12/R1215]AYP68922.1 hypothetical protein [Acinetobacter phage vB_AbaM_IME285]QGH74113.1 hypothetical protein BphiR2
MATVTISLLQPFPILMEMEGKSQVINGWNSPSSMYIDGGFRKVGLTSGVDKELWDAWRARFANHDLLVNQLIYADESSSKVKAEAKEKAKVKTGLEALDPAELDKKGKLEEN